MNVCTSYLDCVEIGILYAGLSTRVAAFPIPSLAPRVRLLWAEAEAYTFLYWPPCLYLSVSTMLHQLAGSLCAWAIAGKVLITIGGSSMQTLGFKRTFA